MLKPILNRVDYDEIFSVGVQDMGLVLKARKIHHLERW